MKLRGFERFKPDISGLYQMKTSDIANLFASGELGFIHDVRAGQVFTDDPPTVEAAIGDAIRVYTDLSGNGADAVQGTLTARAILRLDSNGRRYAEYDLVDDDYAITLPAISGGTVAIFTSKGAWFDSFDFAGGAFTWGPSTYSGGPVGLLDALKEAAGDYREIGRIVIDRALTATEKAGLLAYYGARGCPGEITLGANIVTNGDFVSDLTGWETSSELATWDSGRARLTDGATVGINPVNRFRQQLPTAVGKFYIATAEITNTSMTTFLSLQARVYGPAATVGALLATKAMLPSGGFASIIFNATGSAQIAVLVDTTTTGTLIAHADNIDCREIIFP